MFVALVVEIGNNGRGSNAKAYKVSAKTTYGAMIKIDVFGNAFRLPVNGGRDCFDFVPEHYIMNRTYPKAVERGESITGILPCVFRGIKNAKEVNTDTLKVEFIDVIGDAHGNGKWWRTKPIEGVQWEDPIPIKHRPTLPVLQQPCGNSIQSAPPLPIVVQPSVSQSDYTPALETLCEIMERPIN